MHIIMIRWRKNSAQFMLTNNDGTVLSVNGITYER